MATEPSLSQMAKDYVELLHTSPNSSLAYDLRCKMHEGRDLQAVNKAIDAAFHQRKLRHVRVQLDDRGAGQSKVPAA